MLKNDSRIFCRNAHALRVTHRLTQKEMAAICGISVGELRQIERGILPPQTGLEIVVALSVYFSISISDLFSPTFNTNDRSA